MAKLQPASSNTGFFQKPPVLKNQFHDDVSLQRVTKRTRSAITHASLPPTVPCLTELSLPPSRPAGSGLARDFSARSRGSLAADIRLGHRLGKEPALSPWQWPRCLWPCQERARRHRGLEEAAGIRPEEGVSSIRSVMPIGVCFSPSYRQRGGHQLRLRLWPLYKTCPIHKVNPSSTIPDLKELIPFSDAIYGRVPAQAPSALLPCRMAQPVCSSAIYPRRTAPCQAPNAGFSKMPMTISPPETQPRRGRAGSG